MAKHPHLVGVTLHIFHCLLRGFSNATGDTGSPPRMRTSTARRINPTNIGGEEVAAIAPFPLIPRQRMLRDILHNPQKVLVDIKP